MPPNKSLHEMELAQVISGRSVRSVLLDCPGRLPVRRLLTCSRIGNEVVQKFRKIITDRNLARSNSVMLTLFASLINVI
jgi:hypothetical protein